MTPVFEMHRGIVYLELFHVAPEVLANHDLLVPKTKPGQAADVYSFGMIAYQVLFRKHLFDTTTMSAEGNTRAALY